MPSLSLSLLGPFQATLDGRPITGIESNKVRALLAYLAVEADRPHSRDELIGLLWPDQPDTAARANLRQALANLRQAIGDRTASTPFLLATFDSVQFQRSEHCTIDVVAFTNLIAASQTHAHRRLEACRSCVQHLQQAVELYRGDFLAQFVQSGSEAFEEWALIQRERLHRSVLDALYTLAEHYDRRSEYDWVLRYATRQLELDPWREEAHRQIMRALALSGQRSAALAQYETCRRVLAQELGAEPSQETMALQAKIKADRLTRVDQKHNLPTALTSLIGRRRELIEIDHLLEMPTCRLLTLTGPGGIGKTRLALQAASDHVGLFADGVWLIELAALADPTLVLQAIAAPFGLREQGPHPLREILIDFLKPREVLLVLDNGEHLIEACARATDDLVQACPQVNVLATSREPLNATGEVVFRVPPLTTPDPLHLPINDALTEYEAVQLFVERAVTAVPEFALTEGNQRVIAHICHQLDGMPLAIELAAARVKTLTGEQIATRLADRFSLLTSSNRTVLPRHQTLLAAIDWSYDLLAAPEQTLLRRLAVFAGGWTLDAAETVCVDAEPDGLATGAVVDLLSQLVDKSLVTVERISDRDLRYDLLETIRQYAWRKLVETGELEVERLRDQHLDYWVAVTERAEIEIKGSLVKTWLARLDQDEPNLRAAATWAETSRRTKPSSAERGLRLAAALHGYWSFRGHVGDRRLWMDKALAGTSSRTLARAKALYVSGCLALDHFDHTAGRPVLEESAAIYRELGPVGRAGLAQALRALGAEAAYRPQWYHPRDLRSAQVFFEEALNLSQQMEEATSIASDLNHLAILSADRGDLEAARDLIRESLTIARTTDDAGLIAWCLVSYGKLLMRQGHYVFAQSFLVEALTLAKELSDETGAAGIMMLLGEVEALHDEPNRLERAVRLWGAATGLFEAHRHATEYHDSLQRTMKKVRTQLGDHTFEIAWATGQAMTFGPAIDYAVATGVGVTE